MGIRMGHLTRARARYSCRLEKQTSRLVAAARTLTAVSAAVALVPRARELQPVRLRLQMHDAGNQHFAAN